MNFINNEKDNNNYDDDNDDDDDDDDDDDNDDDDDDDDDDFDDDDGDDDYDKNNSSINKNTTIAIFFAGRIKRRRGMITVEKSESDVDMCQCSAAQQIVPASNQPTTQKHAPHSPHGWQSVLRW